MRKFEYLKTVDSTIEKLNELGSIGWELVSTYTILRSSIYDRDIIHVFKREITKNKYENNT